MIISRTPVRISLFGGGTDYPEYFNQNEGLTLNMAIKYYSYITISQLNKTKKESYYLSYKKIESVDRIGSIVHPSIKNCLKYLSIKEPLQIHYFGDLPAKTGLGSSSSFTVGLLNSLYSLNKIKVDKKKLSEDAIFIERNMIKERVGFQDQIICSYGGIRKINFTPFNKFKTTSIKIDKNIINKIENSILLVFTNTDRYASKILKEQMHNTKSKKLNNHLEEIKSITLDAINIFTNKFNISEIAKLMKESWKIKKDLSTKISNSEINDIYEYCLQNGALAGKILGAGGGGFMLVIGQKKNLKNLSLKLQIKNLYSFFPKIDFSGSKIIYKN